MDKQIYSVSRVNLFHLCNISYMRSLLSDDASSLLIHYLVTTRLDYCNILYHGLPKRLTNKLRRIQNIAARIPTRAPSYDHVKPILYSLHWLPVKSRVKYKLLRQLTEWHQSMYLISFKSTSLHIHCGPKIKDYWCNLIFVLRG